jgi:hypothetical protein
VVYYTNQGISAGSYSITIGSGGAQNQNGSSSTACGYTAQGGGAGGYYAPGNPTTTAKSGASGGGGGGNNDAAGAGASATQGYPGGQGYDPGGGTMGAGGGGCNGAGGDAWFDANDRSTGSGGNGGSGRSYTIGAWSGAVGGGGGGGCSVSSATQGTGGLGGGGNGGANGAANTGGGGGGSVDFTAAGSGGSGIVVISYTYASPPTLSIVGGNNQSTTAGQFNVQPFDVAVWNSAGTQPIVGTSLTFSVQSGGGKLATTNTGSPTLYNTLTLTTDGDGTAQVYYQQPATAGITSQIAASSGGTQILLTTQSTSPTPPPSSPGWVRASTSSPTSVAFSWANSVPASGRTLAGYYIYRNGTQLNGTPQLGTTYTDSGVSAGTAYTYIIRAVDSVGNLSAAATLNVTAPASSLSGTFDVLTPTP